jgi:acetate kinase
MRILVVNAGSSSLKLSVLDEETLVAQSARTISRVRRVGRQDRRGRAPESSTAGPSSPSAVVIDDDVIRRLGALSPLAPLHQPRAAADP